MSKTLCFFHSADLDGHCSGAIVKHLNPEVELHGINYDDEFPWDLVDHLTNVIMVDFSLQPIEEMQRLEERCLQLVLIDHHKSTVEEAERVGFRPPGYLQTGEAGCELTWKYFHGGFIPAAVHLLGRYDVWDHEGRPAVLPFQYGMRMENTWPCDDDAMLLWAKLFARWVDYETLEVKRILANGELLLKNERITNEKYAKSSCFPTELDGLRLIACNKMLTNSMLFTSVWDPTRYDAMCTFGYRKRQWTVSLYTDKPDVDVSVTAKARGGGGHKGASGFQCRELPEGLLR